MNKADLIEVIAGQTGSTKVDAAKALDVIDGAIDMINTQRSNLGAVSNRLDKNKNDQDGKRITPCM